MTYAEVLRRELDGLDDRFSTLEFLEQELQMRAQSIRFQKVAQTKIGAGGRFRLPPAVFCSPDMTLISFKVRKLRFSFG